MSVVSTEQLAAPSRVWQTGLLAAVLASVANVIVYLIADAAGVEFAITPEGVAAPPFAAAVVFATVVGVLLGTLVLTVMPRFSQRPISTFRTVAIVALVLSFAQPLMLVAGLLPTPNPVEWDTVIVLEIMHVVAGVIAIYLLTTRTHARTHAGTRAGA